MFYLQNKYDIRLEWGAEDVSHLAPNSEAVIIIDILSFTTCIDIYLSREATVYPFTWRRDRARASEAKARLAREVDRCWTVAS